MMSKLDYILGMFRTADSKNNTPFFEEDSFISPQRHFDYVRGFKREDQFVAAELKAPERTLNYKLSIFSILKCLAIFLAIIMVIAGGNRLPIKTLSIGAKSSAVQTQQQKQPETPSDFYLHNY